MCLRHMQPLNFKEALSDHDDYTDAPTLLEWARLRFHNCPLCAEPLTLSGNNWECFCWFRISASSLAQYLNANCTGIPARFQILKPYSVAPF